MKNEKIKAKENKMVPSPSFTILTLYIRVETGISPIRIHIF